MDRLTAMEAFVRTVKAGSFSAAAALQMHIGQPASGRMVSSRATAFATFVETGLMEWRRSRRLSLSARVETIGHVSEMLGHKHSRPASPT